MVVFKQRNDPVVQLLVDLPTTILALTLGLLDTLHLAMAAGLVVCGRLCRDHLKQHPVGRIQNPGAQFVALIIRG
jgi:hypothetical protein